MREGLGTAPGADPAPSAVSAPVPATRVRADDLLELTHAVRSELVARGEFLPSSWVEEASIELKTGRLEGWVLPGAPPSGMAFVSRRGQRGFAHVHVTSGPEGLARARRLLRQLAEAGAGSGLIRLEAGVTGLSTSEEDRLADGISANESVLFRRMLELPVPPAPPAPPVLPAGWSSTRPRNLALERLAQLDWESFQDTPDAALVADTPSEDIRVLAEILEGRLGRFLDEASIVLVDAGGEPAALLLTSEQDPRCAVFLDLVVRSEARGKGIGRFLIAWGVRALAALGHSTVRLWVSEPNLPARALYRAAGFQERGRAVIYRFGGTSVAPQPQRSR